MTSGTFTLEIELGNEAMSSPLDLAEALAELSGRIEEEEPRSGIIRDRNGNTVGRFTVELDDPGPEGD